MLEKGIDLSLILLVKCYQLCISPFTPPSCRFTPTCSQYALEALKKHGPVKGLYLAVWRFYAAIPGEEAATIRSPDRRTP